MDRWGEGHLHRLATAWDPERMDIQLLMQSMARVVGETARGDFLMDGDGRLTRRPEQEMASFATPACPSCIRGFSPIVRTAPFP